MTTPPRPAPLSTAALIALCLVAAPAAAQQSMHRILVSDVGGRCSYEIAGQSGQGEFTVEPGGILVLDPVGSVVARAVVAYEATTGAGDGTDVYPVSEGRSAAIDVRPAQGRETVHDLRIECCPGGDNPAACDRWVRAMPADPGALTRTLTGADSTAVPPAVPGTRSLLMGPKMIIRD